MVIRNLRETILRIVLVGVFLGGIWLLLQFYTEAQLAQAARDVWGWWSTRLTGELGVYWNPIGAGITLAVILLFVTQPLRRLFRSRRPYGSHYSDSHYSDSHHYDSDGGSGDGGDDSD
jgi:hypothetical protein